MSDLVRVLVVDDHLIVRQGLRLMLEEAGQGFELAGDAADGPTALRLAEELHPDVVLMDLRMPGMDGLETIEHLRKILPHLAIIILTVYNEDDLMLRGLRAGACGYLLKDTNRETLFNTIKAAARGEMLMHPETMARILAHTTTPAQDYPHQRDGLELTEREWEILAAVVRGDRSKEIAAKLGITMRTVGAHLTNIYAKLGVDSRASAVAVAIQHGILLREPGDRKGSMPSR